MYWTTSRGSSARRDTQFRLRGAVVCSPYGLWIPKGFSQAGLNTNHIKKREPVRPHTEGRTRSTRAVWPVTDPSDRADVDMDAPADPDGLGRDVTDTVVTARVLAAPRTPTKTEPKEHDVSHVPYRPWCRFCVMGRGLERRHLTQGGDRDGDRPRVSADYGLPQRGLNTTVSCTRQTRWHDVRCSRFDEGRW